MKSTAPTASFLARYCNSLLKHSEISDYSGAQNGLQIDNEGPIRKIGAAVDSHELVLQRAIESKVDFLVVHHGIFWTETKPWTGVTLRKMNLAIQNNLALYSSHLPLDAHPQLGNNILLARALGLKTKPFFEEKGAKLGQVGMCSGTLSQLVKRVEKAVGTAPHVIQGGSTKAGRVGIVTGGAGGELARVAAEGIDTFITGEGAHWTFGLAHELKINVIYAGHYATETFGVKALAAHLSKKFSIPWEFIDVPSGL